jgi:hypothetical protein
LPPGHRQRSRQSPRACEDQHSPLSTPRYTYVRPLVSGK